MWPERKLEVLQLPSRPVPEDVGSLVRIHGGSFVMGAPPNAARRPGIPPRTWINLASPAHREVVRDFYIGKYEVTATEFCEFLNEAQIMHEPVSEYVFVDYTSTIVAVNGVFKPGHGCEYAPALHVKWRGARRYCEWLSEKTGETYRLPSEIEWEFAARGPEGRTYPWGEESPLGRAFLAKHYPSSQTVATVGMFPEGASPEGVNDLIGNALEWCGNLFYDYTEASIGADPVRFREFVRPCIDAKTSSRRVFDTPIVTVRSGQYVDAHYHVTTGWVRYSFPVSLPKDNPVPALRGISFRVLREVDKGRGVQTSPLLNEGAEDSSD